jgi:hypothetical protein
VPLVLIRCPKTGRYVSTGINSDPELLSFSSNVRHRIECPYCRKEHAWAKRDAVFCDPERWSDVPQVEDCFLKAAENAERAAAASRDEERQFYLKLEKKWLGLADGFRRIADVDRRYSI